MLTTVGTTVLNTSHVAGQVVTTVITVVGQLYVAILIAGILGKPRQQAADRRAAHLKRRMAGRSSKLNRERR
jgi:hypothetical protein